MPTIRQQTPAALNPSGKARISMTLTPEESAAIDAARGSIPASTWCRDVVVRAAKK